MISEFSITFQLFNLNSNRNHVNFSFHMTVIFMYIKYGNTSNGYILQATISTRNT